jgi:hypothetical protein
MIPRLYKYVRISMKIPHLTVAVTIRGRSQMEEEILDVRFRVESHH